MITDDEKPVVSVKRAYVYNIVLALLGIAVFVLVINLLKEGLKTAAADAMYSKVAQQVVSDDGTHTVNFEVLKDSGCRSQSWICVPGTQIDYPIVIGCDNDYYLDHDAYGRESEAGAIFVNYVNSSDLSDDKTIIFGHNMADGSMFSDVQKYSDSKWGEEHRDLIIYLDNGEQRHYRLMCYLYTDPSYEPVYVVGENEDIAVTAGRLLSDAQVRYSEYGGGKLICLSTCKYHEYRTVAVFEEVQDG